jgi:hypothetical protein
MLDVVIASAVGAGTETTIARGIDTVCAGFPASVTVAVNLKVPVAVGVPEIRPVEVDILSPAGRLPPMDQV